MNYITSGSPPSLSATWLCCCTDLVKGLAVAFWTTYNQVQQCFAMDDEEGVTEVDEITF